MDASADNFVHEVQTSNNVKARTINMNCGYKAKKKLIKTKSDTVLCAHPIKLQDNRSLITKKKNPRT